MPTRHLKPKTVDADGHVLEPRDTWLKYLDPEYRDRPIQLVMEEKGEVLLVDGKPVRKLRNRTALLGGIDHAPDVLLRGGRHMV